MMENLPDHMELHCIMVTEDGGKTWTISSIFYLAPTYYGEFRGVLNANPF